jgi:hypothetical protein
MLGKALGLLDDEIKVLRPQDIIQARQYPGRLDIILLVRDEIGPIKTR